MSVLLLKSSLSPSAEGGMAGVWLPFKELANIVTSAILHKQSDSYYTLEATLKKHKPDFISLLQNPVRKELEGGRREKWRGRDWRETRKDKGGKRERRAMHMYSCQKYHLKVEAARFFLLSSPPPSQAKNPTHRSQVQKAVREGIKTPSLPSLHPLSQDFVDETLVLSDLLDLNELSAVELLLAGEQQQPR